MTKDTIINVALPTFELFVVNKHGDKYELESKKFVVHAVHNRRGINDSRVQDVRVIDTDTVVNNDCCGTDLKYLASIGYRATKKEAWRAKLDKIDVRIQELKDSISKYEVELLKARDARDDIEGNMYEL